MTSVINEEMKSTHLDRKISAIAKKNHLCIQKHVDYNDIDKIYFTRSNKGNPDNEIHCQQGVNYCESSEKIKEY